MTYWPGVPVKPAPRVSFYTPAQPSNQREADHQALPATEYSRPDIPEPPGGEYLTPWHFAHYGGIDQRGPGMMIIEATGVVPEGRIIPGCVWLWKISQIEPFSRVIEFAHSKG
ncbi:hypothetical protein BDW71DRAFT_203178 [Aspergillus fruticulosus]